MAETSQERNKKRPVTCMFVNGPQPKPKEHGQKKSVLSRGREKHFVEITSCGKIWFGRLGPDKKRD